MNIEQMFRFFRIFISLILEMGNILDSGGGMYGDDPVLNVDGPTLDNDGPAIYISSDDDDDIDYATPAKRQKVEAQQATSGM